MITALDKDAALLKQNAIKFFEKLNEPAWLLQQRKNSMRQLKILPELKLKYGISLYNSLAGFNLKKINPLESSEEIKIKNNEGDAIVLDFKKALKDKKYSGILKEYFLRSYPAENKIAAFHSAFWSSGLLIFVPENKSCEIEIEIIDGKISLSHLLVVCGRNSKAKIIEKLGNIERIGNQRNSGIFKSHVVEAFLMKNATLSHESIHSNKANSFITKRAVADESASMKWYDANLGLNNSRIEVSTDLIGKGASTKNYGIFLADKNQQLDIYNSAIHSAANTASDMDNKGIVSGNAKSIYRGLIDIKENSRNSNGYQKQDTLMLSKTAEANSIPNLEIKNNDVKCSHGATVGKIDEKKIFYLMSRGLSRQEAEKEIVKGFFAAMLEKVHSEKFRKLLGKAIENAMEKLTLEDK